MIAGSIFHTLIVKPIFNLLVLIYALLPGHNFGLSLIIFTVVVRLLMWPMVKKQLHQAKVMRQMQPELKRIKKAAAGDRQKESLMLMELYKERGVNPFGSFGTLVIQLIILIGLYSGLRSVVADPHAIITGSYGWVHNLSWLKVLSGDIHRFDASLFGVIDLTRSAIVKKGPTYWPAMLLVIGSAVSQYFQSKQLLPSDKEARSLRTILKEAGSGKQTDQNEVNAAVGRTTRFFIPGMIFLFTVSLPSALSLYWFVSGLTAYIQQARVLSQDEVEMEKLADKPSPAIIEGEVIEKTPPQTKKKTTTKKRRRR